MEYEIFVITRLFDKRGKLVKERRFKSKSFLLNYAKMMGAIFGLRSDTFVLDDGTKATQYGYSDEWKFRCQMKTGAGIENIGIVIGRGTTPVSVEDYCLADKITHGTGVGQMNYGSCDVSAIGYTPNWSRVIVSRTFTNLSGASIDVNEIGSYLYTRSKVGGVDREVRFLCLRDVLPTTDTVPDGYTYTVSYEIRWSA